jgi:ABC-type microcin C transport system duplicated ATPase subunit YejF
VRSTVWIFTSREAKRSGWSANPVACALRLIEPMSGDIRFSGKSVLSLDREKLRALRRDIQIIFQDPYASLDPRMTVGAIVGEALIIHRLAKSRRQLEERIVNLLETVGLKADHMSRYPRRMLGRRAPVHRNSADARGRAEADNL